MLIDKHERFIFWHPATDQPENDNVFNIQGRIDLFDKTPVAGRRGVAILPGKRGATDPETGNRDHPRDVPQFRPASDHSKNLWIVQIEGSYLAGKLKLTSGGINLRGHLNYLSNTRQIALSLRFSDNPEFQRQPSAGG
jgi:hypothetical protein